MDYSCLKPSTKWEISAMIQLKNNLFRFGASCDLPRSARRASWRGQVSGTDIGSIAVHPNASTFDVHERVAPDFAWPIICEISADAPDASM